METTWHGTRAIEYRNTKVAIVVVPGRGGKIVSLRALGWEWLAQPALPVGPGPTPGDAFVEGDMCGWDECAPSIVACTLPHGPGPCATTELPDHGELWTMPWDVNPGDSAQTMALGPVSGCKFERTVSVGPGASVRLEYQVTAGGADAVFLWAAHPQLRAPRGSRVVLDGAVETVVDVGSSDDVRRLVWSSHLADIGSVAPGASRKIYLEPTERTESAELVLADGRALTFRWDPSLLPYLGIWFDRAHFSREDVVAIEPSTGWYDSAARALALGHVLTIPAGETVAWWIDLSFEGPA